MCVVVFVDGLWRGLFSFLFGCWLFPGDNFFVFEAIFGFNLGEGFFFFACSVCLVCLVTGRFFLFSGGFSAWYVFAYSQLAMHLQFDPQGREDLRQLHAALHPFLHPHFARPTWPPYIFWWHELRISRGIVSWTKVFFLMVLWRATSLPHTGAFGWWTLYKSGENQKSLSRLPEIIPCSVTTRIVLLLLTSTTMPSIPRCPFALWFGFSFKVTASPGFTSGKFLVYIAFIFLACASWRIRPEASCSILFLRFFADSSNALILPTDSPSPLSSSCTWRTKSSVVGFWAGVIWAGVTGLTSGVLFSDLLLFASMCGHKTALEARFIFIGDCFCCDRTSFNTFWCMLRRNGLWLRRESLSVSLLLLEYKGFLATEPCNATSKIIDAPLSLIHIGRCRRRG